MSTKKPRWTSTDTEFIERNWKTMTDEQLALLFGCSVRRVVEKRWDLGLLRKRPITTNDLHHVQVNYQHSTYAAIGDDIGRKKSSVWYIMAKYLNAHSPNGMRKREAA